MVNDQSAVIFKHIKCVLVKLSGQLRILGLCIARNASIGALRGWHRLGEPVLPASQTDVPQNAKTLSNL